MTRDELDPDERGSVARADLILTGIPPAFAGAFSAGSWAFNNWVGAAAAALVCCALVADGLFVHPPDGE